MVWEIKWDRDDASHLATGKAGGLNSPQFPWSLICFWSWAVHVRGAFTFSSGTVNIWESAVRAGGLAKGNYFKKRPERVAVMALRLVPGAGIEPARHYVPRDLKSVTPSFLTS